MKNHIVLILIVVLGIVLIIGGAALWHLSNTTEFTRADAQSAPANPIR